MQIARFLASVQSLPAQHREKLEQQLLGIDMHYIGAGANKTHTKPFLSWMEGFRGIKHSLQLRLAKPFKGLSLTLSLNRI
jgi:hypothetical protein